MDADDMPRLYARDPNKPWSMADFEIGRPLGSGRFGKVYLAREVKNKYIVAQKVIFKKTIEKHQLQNAVIREVEIQSTLKHPNILRLFGCFDDNERVVLILEYAYEGALFGLLQKNGNFTEKVAARIWVLPK